MKPAHRPNHRLLNGWNRRERCLLRTTRDLSRLSKPTNDVYGRRTSGARRLRRAWRAGSPEAPRRGSRFAT